MGWASEWHIVCIGSILSMFVKCSGLHKRLFEIFHGPISIWAVMWKFKSTEIVAHYFCYRLLCYEISCVGHSGCVNSWKDDILDGYHLIRESAVYGEVFRGANQCRDTQNCPNSGEASSNYTNTQQGLLFLRLVANLLNSLWFFRWPKLVNLTAWPNSIIQGDFFFFFLGGTHWDLLWSYSFINIYSSSTKYWF